MIKLCSEYHDYYKAFDKVKLLIDHFKDQIDINFTDDICYTALHVACSSDNPNIDMVKLLIDNFKDEIDIWLENEDGDTPLHLACFNDNIDIVKLLIDKFKEQIGINLTNDNPPFQRACYCGKFDLAKLLLDNFKEKIDINLASDEDGDTSLHIACINGDIDIVKLIIDNFKDEIDIMLLGYCDKPAYYDYLLHFGQKSFKDIFLPLLLNRDKSKDPQGLTPLHIAYLLRNKTYRRRNSDETISGESILQYLLSIPELIEFDGLQRDKFQTLPHQVTPLPPGHYWS